MPGPRDSPRRLRPLVEVPPWDDAHGGSSATWSPQCPEYPPPSAVRLATPGGECGDVAPRGGGIAR
eukprot:scaffold256443_cov33-Tisochrysis_lutea.AAC.3